VLHSLNQDRHRAFTVLDAILRSSTILTPMDANFTSQTFAML
jgi:hypothetical protein